MRVDAHVNLEWSDPVEVKLSQSTIPGLSPFVSWRFGPPLEGVTIHERVSANCADRLRQVAATLLVNVADEIDRLPSAVTRA